MKHSKIPALLFAFSLVCGISAFGQQPTVTELYPPTSAYLRGVHFIDTQAGWAVGGGIVLATGDGGDSWSAVSGLNDAYEDISFLDTQTGLIMGHNGIIIRTADGGNNWSAVTSTTTQDLNAVAWGTGGVVYAVGAGGVILRSTDDGANWATIRSDGVDLLDVWAVGPDRAWAVGKSRDVRVTFDGGDSWSLQDCGESVSTINGVHFLTESEGWLVRGSTLYHSTDGGLNWTNQSISFAMNVAVQFLDDTHGFACGGAGGIWYTSNGTNWNLLANNIADNVLDLFLLDICRGWVVGESGLIARIDCGGGNDVPYIPNCSATTAATGPVVVVNSPGGDGQALTAAQATAGGTTDATITVTVENVAGDPIVGYPAQNLWLTSESGGLVSCVDGTIADGPTDTNGMATFTGPFSAGGYSDFTGGERAVVVIDGQNLTGYEMEIYFNSPDINGDMKVDCHDTDIFNGDLVAYHFRSDFVYDQTVGLADLINFTSFLGRTCLNLPDPAHCTVATAAAGWASLFNAPDGSGDDLSDCYEPGGGRVDATLVVTVLNSNDSPVTGVSASDIWLDFGSDNVVACTGLITADAATDAAGVTTFTGPYKAGGWTEGPIGVTLSIDGCLYDLGDVQIKFKSSDIDGDLDADGSDEVILLGDIVPNNLRSDFNFDSQVGVADQTLFSQHVMIDCNGPTSSVTLPPVLSLLGNRPNPFNPRTTLAFELATPAKVTLVIYDVRGRLVRILFADREYAAGLQEEVWDGKDNVGKALPSGTYFCRLRTGEKTENRKMSLVR